MTHRYTAGTVMYLLAFLISLVSVAVGLAFVVILALLFVLPEPVDRRRSASG